MIFTHQFLREMHAFQALLPVSLRFSTRATYLTRTAPRQKYASVVTMTRVDAHVHVWTPAYAPVATHPLPPIEGSVETLIAGMDDARIDKTLIVQPINYKFDHACVDSALAAYPTRLYGVALADTTLAPDAAAKYVTERFEAGYRGIRVNPNFAGLRSATVQAVLEVCGQYDRPACLFVKPEHLADVEHLLQTTQAKLIVDHFAFCTSEADVASLLRLADYDRLYVKASAWFRVSDEENPHADAQRTLHKVIDKFGAKRVMVGSDFPFVTEQYSYAKAFEPLHSAQLAPEDLEMVGGGSAMELYKL